MLLSVLRRSCAVLFMAAAVGCIAAEPDEVGEVEGEETGEAESQAQAQAQAEETEAVEASDDASLMPIPPGCGGFKQRCCAGNVCSGYLECDLGTLTCLY